MHDLAIPGLNRSTFPERMLDRGVKKQYLCTANHKKGITNLFIHLKSIISMKQPIKYSLSLRANPMKPEEAKKAYATIQLNQVLSLEDLAEHIHDHNTVFSKGVILGVLIDMTHCVKEALMEGNAVKLGDLGRFSPTITSEGAETMEVFTSEANIKKLNVVFENGSGLDYKTEDLDFEYTITRAAQAAAKKAQKAGETSADWTPKEEEEEEQEP